MVKRVVAAAGTSMLLAACFFVSDFSDLSGGVTDAGPGPADAKTDVDAPADAADPCSGALFCEDFRSGSAAAWRSFTSDPNVVLAVEPFTGAPSPNVLRVAIPARPTTGTYAYLSKEVPTARPITSAKLAFQLAIDRLDATSRACVAAIVFGDNTGSEHVVRLLVGGPNAMLEEKFANETKRYDLTGAVTTGSFRAVAISVAAKGKITVDVNGRPALDIAADPSWAETNGVRIVLGVNFTLGPANIASGFDFRFDDVRLTGN